MMSQIHPEAEGKKMALQMLDADSASIKMFLVLAKQRHPTLSTQDVKRIAASCLREIAERILLEE
jgi:hypothetical protein